MSLFGIAWKYLWSRPLVTMLTLASIALGCALIASVLTLRRASERALIAESGIFDMVVGAKGSPLQLVLSSVYHLDTPTGNIPYARYEALRDDRRVRRAVPVGLGDNYQGFRIVGTNGTMFETMLPTTSGGEPQALFKIEEGNLFSGDFEAVLGAEAAAQTSLQMGQTFEGSHGLVDAAGSAEHHEEPYKVVGILERTGTSADRAIYVSLGSIWHIHEHKNQSDDQTSPTREVTAVLIQLKSAGMRLWMTDEIKNKTESMAAIPLIEMHRLYQQILQPLQQALIGMAALVVVVAALTILTTLYQATERRRREVAVMRALGAHPAEIFMLIVLEALALTLCGIVAGWFIGHLGVWVAALYFRQRTGMSIDPWSVDWAEASALGVVAIVGAMAGLLPAWLAYRRPPVRDLTAT